MQLNHSIVIKFSHFIKLILMKTNTLGMRQSCVCCQKSMKEITNNFTEQCPTPVFSQATLAASSLLKDEAGLACTPSC